MLCYVAEQTRLLRWEIAHAPSFVLGAEAGGALRESGVVTGTKSSGKEAVAGIGVQTWTARPAAGHAAPLDLTALALLPWLPRGWYLSPIRP